MANSLHHRRARILFSTKATTSPQPSKTCCPFPSLISLTMTRKLRPNFLEPIPDDQWRTSRHAEEDSTTSDADARAVHRLAEVPLPPTPFPQWIHLQANADFFKRQQLTTEIAQIISACDGSISHQETNSDMITELHVVLEEACPEQLSNLQDRLHSIGVIFEGTSLETLQECSAQLSLKQQQQKSIPTTTMDILLQLHWNKRPRNY